MINRDNYSLLAIDALNIIRRIYEAIKTQEQSDIVYEAAKSSISSIRRALSEHRPTHAVVVFDYGGKTWRHELFDKYKENRDSYSSKLNDVISIVKNDLIDLNIKWIAIPNIEADDAIAALAEKWTKYSAGHMIIVSTDKDMCQLCSSQIKVRNHFNNTWHDEKWIFEKFGVGVSQLGDLLALMGDSTDGIPGIDSVGKKTAARLLKIFGNLERIISNSDKISGKAGESIRKNSDVARMCRKLVDFKTDISLGLTWKQLEQKYYD